jgi:hypothetical protein
MPVAMLMLMLVIEIFYFTHRLDSLGMITICLPGRELLGWPEGSGPLPGASPRPAAATDAYLEAIS